MTDNQKDRLLDAEIRYALRTTPDEKVPEGFAARVMDGLEPKRLPAWRRLWMWLTGRQSLTFRPLQVLPVATCALALLVLGVLHMNPDAVRNETVNMHNVRFVLHDAGMNAKTVSVIGSFNGWEAGRSVMWYDEQQGVWTLEAVLPSGDHEYMFLVDGERLVPDPQAAMSRDDGFGNKNSILFVNGVNEQAL